MKKEEAQKRIEEEPEWVQEASKEAENFKEGEALAVFRAKKGHRPVLLISGDVHILMYMIDKTVKRLSELTGYKGERILADLIALYDEYDGVGEDAAYIQGGKLN